MDTMPLIMVTTLIMDMDITVINTLVANYRTTSVITDYTMVMSLENTTTLFTDLTATMETTTMMTLDTTETTILDMVIMRATSAHTMASISISELIGRK